MVRSKTTTLKLNLHSMGPCGVCGKSLTTHKTANEFEILDLKYNAIYRFHSGKCTKQGKERAIAYALHCQNKDSIENPDNISNEHREMMASWT